MRFPTVHHRQEHEVQLSPGERPESFVVIGRNQAMEQEIYQMLQQTPGVLYSVKEIGKRLDREQYKENPNWARPFLESLLHQHSIEADENGYFFYPKRHKLGEIL
jgi:hypothetical protein